ncbi:hypothetical protein QYS49_14355 [Marivirga salinae]|uniref:Uncharacterized protein n=1 Tax=Marivirga salinarum TaxID=3059078 RepID=A0AA49J902_9BACT|nr:hypothetical protein [Marivirga sp. BDSF4-3]WKK78118.2 hypothetical protein QYS49_14355 [Marivirga sp. BDSF4-3]
MNYLDSNYQPYDGKGGRYYVKSCKYVNDLLFQAWKAQVPNAVIDSSTSVQMISGLAFQTFKIEISYPQGITVHSLSYSRLFDKKEFSVNILYVDRKQGEKLINAWQNSVFK